MQALGGMLGAGWERPNLRSLGAEARGVVRDVLADVGRNEVVRVVTRPNRKEEEEEEEKGKKSQA
eukprot:2909297-Rhodomonas_salina.2